MSLAKTDINTVVMSGAVDSAPKIMKTKNDTEGINLSLAAVRNVVTAEGTKMYTSWFNVSSFSKSVVDVVKQLNKDDQILVQGSLTVRSWHDQTGQKRIRYEVMAEKITILGKTDGNAENMLYDGSENSNENDAALDDDIFS